MRRHADRARAVAALVQRAVARRRADAGAGRRGAGIQAVLPGIVRDAGQRAVADAHPAELGRRRLAEDDRARAAQARDHGVVGVRDVAAAQMGAILDLHAAHGLVILDRHRHAVQRPDRLALGQRAIGRLGCVHRLLRRQIGEGVQPGLERRDAIEHGGRELDGRQFLGADGVDQLGRRGKAEIDVIHGDGSGTACASASVRDRRRNFR